MKGRWDGDQCVGVRALWDGRWAVQVGSMKGFHTGDRCKPQSRFVDYPFFLMWMYSMFLLFQYPAPEKIDALKIMGGRLAHLTTHDALLLVKHSFALPKLLCCTASGLHSASCHLVSKNMTIVLRPLLMRSPTSTSPM